MEGPGRQAVTDTHSLIWYAAGRHRRLGRKALEFFRAADERRALVHVPTTVLMEVSEALRAGRLELETPFAAWIEALFAAGPYLAAPLEVAVVTKSHDLFAIPERGDRLIAATAAVLGCPLISRDPEIRRTKAIATIWE